MKRLLPAFFLWTFLTILGASNVHATSPQAYQDYRFQFDQYRQKLTDFQSAYSQYQQFNSLTSLQDTLDKGKLLLAQRNLVARTYFLFLNEKLTEDPGLAGEEEQTYRTLLTNQVGLLETNTSQVPGIGDMAELDTVSTTFIKNYFAMQSSYRQIIVGLQIGYLQYFLEQFDATASQAQILIAASRGDATPEKIAVMDRWLTALSNKHSLLTEQIKTIRLATTKLTGDTLEQDRQLATIRKTMNAAKQNLVEAASYLGELEAALHYE